ncbi:MAG: HAD family hydrolase [Gaiellaceae bacterium]
MERWATFDCYGTLIDWNGGIGRELERLFGADRAAGLLHGYHAHERQVQHEEPSRRYRDVMTMAVARLAEQEGLTLAAGEEEGLARSLPGWQPFPEVPAALEDARARGWRLAILSNTDRDYLDASLALIGVPFDVTIVASEIGSYKPAKRHWEAFAEQVDTSLHAHVAASLFHDIAPATELGLPTVWIDRFGEDPEPEPGVRLHSLTGLGDALDSLVA